MSSDPRAIVVDRLGKDYVIRHRSEHATTVGEAIVARLRHPLARAERELFTAVDDVSFTVNEGEVVGIIGRNGAGKSTLLKLLTRITAPTRGEIHMFGRVGSLLEVGTGFHPELTGRENIYLNGSILGMRRKEIDRLFDEIVEFSGVEQFLDTPVKRYSSGMYVRLAFAVAAHLQADVLVVDEVLAVGDAEFQEKSLGKMKSIAAEGHTVLFVSHQMAAVSSLCTRGIYLEHGRVDFDGEINGAVDRYVSSYIEDRHQTAADLERRGGSGEYRCVKAAARKPAYECAEEKVVDFVVERRLPTPDRFFMSAVVKNADGLTLAQCDSRLLDFYVEGTDRFHGSFSLRTPWLRPGTYTVDVMTCIPGTGIIDYLETAARWVVTSTLPYPTLADDNAIETGEVLADFDWQAQ